MKSALSAICILISLGLALTPRFHPADVVRHVRPAHPKPPAAGCEQLPDDGEFLIDTSGVHEENLPAAAFDGRDYLVVWRDSRNDNWGDIYGARVTQAGDILDQGGIPISTPGQEQTSPAVASDGTGYLVVWQDDRSDDLGDIYGARMTSQGIVLDTAGFVIAQGTDIQDQPVLCSDGSNFLVAWVTHNSSSGDYGICGARVTPQGMVLDTAGFAITQRTRPLQRPALAFDGTNYLAAWEVGNIASLHDICGARVTPEGILLDSSGINISKAEDSQSRPALCFDGTNFLAVWEDYLRFGIYGARVTPAGTVLDTAGFVVSQDGGQQPALCFDGANFLVVWQTYDSGYDNLYGARVTPAGVVFDGGPVVRQEGSQYYPVLTRGAGNRMFLVYQGWVGTAGGKTYNTYRTWGKMNPSPGTEETPNTELRMTNAASIVRNVLFLPGASGRKPLAASWLLDITGRKVLDLRPGSNDVQHLVPGVYFVREAQAQAVRKVVVTR